MTGRNHSAVEARRQAVQAELDARRSAAERNRLGQFATPYSLAVEIVRYLQSITDGELVAIRFADPAIGTGSFYSAALEVFGAEQLERAIGIEVDSAICDASRDLWSLSGLELICCDFARVVSDSSCPPPPNLILANPPYVRHHHLGREVKERLQALVRRMSGVEVNGLAGLYVYFLILATAWMEHGGYAAWLVPSEFMDVNYGTALKRFLTDHLTLIRVHRFDPDDVQFDDVLVSSAVLVFRKMPAPQQHVVQCSFGGSLGAPQACDFIPLERLRQSRKWTVYPEHHKNEQRLSNAAGPTLGDLFRIQRGIATGSNGFFVLERGEADHRGLPHQFLRPILPSPRCLKTTIIDADDQGYPRIDPQLCVLDCDLPEHVVKDRYPALWGYLESAEALRIKDGYLVGKRTPWYKQERRDPAPFLCTYMGRGSNQKRPFRFIWNRSRAIGTNLYLMLYPKSGLAAVFRNDPTQAGDAFALLGQITAHELRGEGRVYGGGLHKIEPSELARISAALFFRRWPELSSLTERQSELFG